MRKQAVICFYMLQALLLNAQEKLGISNSNYSSTNSIFLNPASSVDSRTYMQLNLAGLNAYAMNNMAYIPGFSFWGAAKTGGVPDFKTNGNVLNLKKFLSAVASVEGPAFVISKDNYGAGFFIRARSVGEIKRVPFALANFLLNPDTTQKLNYPVKLDLKNARFSNMSWVEYGLNFGMMIKKEKTTLVSLGGSIKYITSLNIAYGNVQRLNLAIEPNSIDVNKLQGKLRFNDFGWNTGKGLGLDVGITYKKMLDAVNRYYANSKLSNCSYIDYKYKLGISLRDLGAVRFKKNTTAYNINASGHFNTDTTNKHIDYRKNLEYNFNTTSNNNPILGALPTSLSIQLDWNFGNHFYLNGTVIKNVIPNTFTGVQGSNLLSVCPRYEFKLFEVAMPLTLQKYIYPQLGFAFRVRSFVLGFDNMFPLIIKKKTYGVGVYLNLGISLFTNPACRKKLRKVDDCPPNTMAKKNSKEKKRSSLPRRKWFQKKKSKRE